MRIVALAQRLVLRLKLAQQPIGLHQDRVRPPVRFFVPLPA